MQKSVYLIWGLWLIVGLALGLFGVINWWVATSAIWGIALSFLSSSVLIVLTSDFGEYLKRRKLEKIPDSCKNCLFGKTSDLVNASKKEGEEPTPCLGEKMAGAKKGTLCSFYSRHD